MNPSGIFLILAGILLFVVLLLVIIWLFLKEGLDVLRSNGSPCNSSLECLSGWCTGNIVSTGICAVPATSGTPCTEDSQCGPDGACGRQTAGPDAPLICCPSGSTDLYAGYDYCTGMPDNSVCWSDAMCESLYCHGNLGGLQRGICTARPQ